MVETETHNLGTCANARFTAASEVPQCSASVDVDSGMAATKEKATARLSLHLKQRAAVLTKGVMDEQSASL